MTLSFSGIRSWWVARFRHAATPAVGDGEVDPDSKAAGASADGAEAPREGRRRRNGRGSGHGKSKGRRRKSRSAEAATQSDELLEAAGPEPTAESIVTTPSGEEPARRRSARTYAREAAALVLLASALYAGLAIASFRGDPLRPEVVGEDWVGPVGAVFAGFFVRAVGVIAWLIVVELALIARPLLLDRPAKLSVVRLSGNVLLAVTAASLVHIALPEARAFGAMPLGGTVGELFGEVLRGLFSTVGSYLVGLTVVALILLQRATFSFIDWVQRFQGWLTRFRARCDDGMGAVVSAWGEARRLELARREQQRRAAEPLIAVAERADAIIAAFADDGDGSVGPRPSGSDAAHRASLPETPERLAQPAGDSGASFREASPIGELSDGAPVASTVLAVPPEQPLPASGTAAVPDTEAETPSPTPQAPAPPDGQPVDEAADGSAELIAAAEAGTAEPEPKRAIAGRGGKGRARRSKGKLASAEDAGPRIVDTSEAARTDRSGKRRGRASLKTRYRLPTTDFLETPRQADVVVDEQALRQRAKLLTKTLADYGVQGEVVEIHPGPTVTTFEVVPAPGTKVSKVAGLADDLALGLSRKVRIVAPIPGKNRVGFEVPNDRRVPVNLRELVEDRRFLEMKAPLPCVLGRDIIGAPVFADLASMPHVIVAGATGAGKSVGLNVMLVSLLFRRTPDELKLLLIDPKVVELAPFDRIPHLLLPVVTDMKQAANALKWAVDEMERRYQLFADAGTRNIKSYNAWAKKVRAGKIPAPKGPKRVQAIAPDGTEVEVPAAKDGSDAPLPDVLPFIVVVVEEFADLMMQQGKDVEAAVARLAQKARAAGMHVIVATQRPSVDVITGLIKANFPTRIAYRVAQKVDSRTILDEQGAEHLLGKGDMLVKLNGTSDCRRVQCPFCSEEEVQRVTDMLREQGEPQYDESILQARDADEEGADPGDAERDPLYDQAVRIVAETRRCSTSWIQRKLGIGYNRAAKIVETMERLNVVGPPNGSKDREIFVSPQ